MKDVVIPTGKIVPGIKFLLSTDEKDSINAPANADVGR